MRRFGYVEKEDFSCVHGDGHALRYTDRLAGKSGNTYYGAELNKDTLRVCIDTTYLTGHNYNEYSLSTAYTDLAKQLQTGLGIENITVEVLPDEGAERQTALQRLRTEIMSGGGPDVFILKAVEGPAMDVYEGAILNFPGKNMEAGLFLPLDEYIENNTRFTDWDAQTKVILDAGKTDEGQVIIPLTYTFPVTVCPRHAITIPYTTDLTMQEILDNPETAELGAVLYSSLEKTDENHRGMMADGLPYLLGTLADYKNEELLFTEEELYNTLSIMNSLHDAVEETPYSYVQRKAGTWLIHEMNTAYLEPELALVPHYSRNGGVTASITAYAAVNRNTRFPEEAFSVIDYISQEKMQLESELYGFLLGVNELPLQNDIGQEEKPFPNGSYFKPDLFRDLLEIKEQITEVNFKCELDMTLQSLMEISILDDTVSKEAVSKAYDTMKRMVGE